MLKIEKKYLSQKYVALIDRRYKNNYKILTTIILTVIFKLWNQVGLFFPRWFILLFYKYDIFIPKMLVDIQGKNFNIISV